MIRKIVKGEKFFLKAEPAGPEDISVMEDLADTLKANREACVGMAANMIGVNKRIIAFSVGPFVVTMMNPEITRKFGGTYEAEEGCLSLDGVRKTTRYNQIIVEFDDANMVRQRKKYEGTTAQIIQHEIDHCDGIII